MSTMKLRPHQERFLASNPSKALLVWEMRTGKSLPAALWSNNPSRNSNPYVVCLKANKKDWVKLCPHATVYTKEEFKKYQHEIVQPSCIVVDEAHNFAAPLFITKKRSKQAEALYNLIRRNPHMHVLLLTATPLTNDPASLHTLLTYIGKFIPWKEYQQKFYVLEYKPFLPRPAYFPVMNWRKHVNEILKEHADIVSLADCVSYMPPSEDEVVHVKHTKRPYAPDEEYHWTKDHKHEQVEKITHIRAIGDGFRKVIVVCHYIEQIDELSRELSKDRPVFVLDGRTKDQAQVIQDAQNSTDCYFIVQAKIGMGWDGYMFGCMVFASMAHRVIDHTQMKGRLTSVDHPKPLLYYYLVAGKWDKIIYESVMAGEDFNPHKYGAT